MRTRPSKKGGICPTAMERPGSDRDEKKEQEN
jgi:hypothetical protein